MAEERSLTPRARLLLRHATATVPGIVTAPGDGEVTVVTDDPWASKTRSWPSYKLAHAATISRTAWAEVSNIWRSVASSSMTTTFSTPRPPMMAGTPM
jgi:hypothetical protein